MKPWLGLADFVEDARHFAFRLRNYLGTQNLIQGAATTRAMVDAGKAAAAHEGGLDAADRSELELADYLVGQYEAAVTFMTSMIQE